MTELKCAKAPCKSCPYRKDVPSGVWAAAEYDKLPDYDGSIGEQLAKKAGGVFMCHQQDGCLCAGWVGTHGANNLAAMRLAGFYEGTKIDPAVWEYKSPVPLFKCGAEAAAHGKRAIARPGTRARSTIGRLVRKRDRRAATAKPPPGTD